MLKKIYRLNEKEVKKVLLQKKPFFSYWLVLNSQNVKKTTPSCGIVIGAKSVKNNVHRVFFRRMFYSIIQRNFSNIPAGNLVFVVKKTILLDKNDSVCVASFEKDILFLLKKYSQSVL